MPVKVLKNPSFITNEKLSLKDIFNISESFSLNILIQIYSGDKEEGIILVEHGNITYAKSLDNNTGKDAIFYLFNLENKTIKPNSNSKIHFDIFFIKDENGIVTEECKIAKILDFSINTKYDNFIEQISKNNNELVSIVLLNKHKKVIEGFFCNTSIIEKDLALLFSENVYSLSQNKNLKYIDNINIVNNQKAYSDICESHLLIGNFVQVVKKIDSTYSLIFIFNEKLWNNKPFILKNFQNIAYDLEKIIDKSNYILEVKQNEETKIFSIQKKVDIEEISSKTLNIFESEKYNKDLNIFYLENLKKSLFFSFSELDKVEHNFIKNFILQEDVLKHNLSLKEGDKVGKSTIVKLVGVGLTSNVYKATHSFLGINVALKVLSPKLKKENPDIEQMFLQEARNTANLKHENLVKIFDAENGDKYTYMVMEFVDGINLSYILEAKKTLKPLQAVEIMLTLCNVLDYALQNKFIHRDIKPENIMISNSLEIKLLDLGLSKIIENTSKNSSNIVGTPYYMSPEQFLNSDSVDSRSDIYSLGVTFYHLLNGFLPFKSKSLKDLVVEKLETDLIVFPKTNDVPIELQELLIKMLRKKTTHRIQSYKELKNLLTEIRRNLKLEK